MFQNRVFVLSILALLAILMFSTVWPVSASSNAAAPYQAELTAWTISGNAGVAGAVLTYDDGGTKTVTAGSGGGYSILVPDGWVGVVTPSLAGYTFSPTSTTYSTPGVTADITGQNYTATAHTPTPTATQTSTPSRTNTLVGGITLTKTPTLTRTPTPTTPSGFSKIYPWNGAANLNTTTIAFSWKSYSPTPDKYRYCIDKINNNVCDSSGGFTSVTGTSVTLSNLAQNTTYYWHIQAVDCLNADCSSKTIIDTNSGAWWSFGTGNLPTATPTRTATSAATRTRTATPKPTSTKTRTATATPYRLTAQSAGAYDGWILESAENSNTGGTMNAIASTFQVGDHATNRQFRAILSFDTSGLPDTATVTSAVLRIKKFGAVIGTDPFTILGVLRADIYQGSFGSAADLALEDFNAAASATQVAAFSTTPTSGWYSAPLNASGRTNISTMGITQFRLYFSLDDNNNNAADFIRFTSGNSTDEPVLVITYTP